jgi:hypothetical protein
MGGAGDALPLGSRVQGLRIEVLIKNKMLVITKSYAHLFAYMD